MCFNLAVALPFGCSETQEGALWTRSQQLESNRARHPLGTSNGRTTSVYLAWYPAAFHWKVLPRFDDGGSRCYDRSAGWSSLVARWAHNPKVGGSNPPPATNFFNQLQPFGPERSAHFSLIPPAIARQLARARPVFGHSRLGCICSLSWRCWNAARVPAAPSHRCGSHVAGKNTSAGTCASPQS